MASWRADAVSCAGCCELELQIGDPQLEFWYLGQALLGVDQQLGEAIAFLEAGTEVSDDQILVGDGLVHPREAIGPDCPGWLR